MSGEITNKEFVEVHINGLRSLITSEFGKVKSDTDNIKETISEIKEQNKIRNGRIERLERNQIAANLNIAEKHLSCPIGKEVEKLKSSDEKQNKVIYWIERIESNPVKYLGGFFIILATSVFALMLAFLQILEKIRA